MSDSIIDRVTLNHNNAENISYKQNCDTSEAMHPQSNADNDIYSVTSLSLSLKQTVARNFTGVKVRGEISGCKIAASGHVYFNLKDSNAVLNAICWKSTASKFKIEDGMEVICTGNLGTYPERSIYQIIVNKIEFSGHGALLAMLEQRKQKFALEGLFNNKRPLPQLPQSIGIITSTTGAVIQDIMHRIDDRFPLKLLIWGTPVQGNDAAASIANAINGFSNMQNDRPDIIIVARGGGSIEDLWAFNEEIVVRATHACTIPVISAIGHETDFTLIDFAADLRAPTPTAAAEMAVPVRSQIAEMIHAKMHRIKNASLNHLNEKKLQLTQISRSIAKSISILSNSKVALNQKINKIKSEVEKILHDRTLQLNTRHKALDISLMEQSFANSIQKLDISKEKLDRYFNEYMKNTTTQLLSKQQILQNLSHTNTLKRGFSITRNNEGDIITDANSITQSEEVEIEFANGTSRMKVI